MPQPFNINNFDLIRLFAASQVAISHSLHHLQINSYNWLTSILELFPGVPVFFFISGFLISRAFEKSPDVLKYSLNRIVRIFPALIFCTLISISAVYLTGYFSKVEINPLLFIGWSIGQITFVQFFNPDFMRGYGTGVLNGSLWTITVELQFYFVIPIVYLIAKFFRLKITQLLLSFLVTFLLISIFTLSLADTFRDHLLYKLWNITFAPWVYMFFIGTIFQRKFNFCYSHLAGRAWIMLPLYLIVALIYQNILDASLGNEINPILFILLAATIFSLSYSLPNLSNKLLNRNDISYGVYIYHMPIINLLIYNGMVANSYYFYLALALTVALSLTSWKLIERPCLALKRHSLIPITYEKKGIIK